MPVVADSDSPSGDPLDPVPSYRQGSLEAIARHFTRGRASGDRMRRIVDAAAQANERITVPTVVLAEWWRGKPSKRMARLLDGVEIEPLDARIATVAGAALAAVRGATTIDAIVVASAAQRGDIILTSDVEDLDRLARYFRGVRVLHS
jgi:predicted nucleic acid-binding protein